MIARGLVASLSFLLLLGSAVLLQGCKRATAVAAEGNLEGPWALDSPISHGGAITFHGDSFEMRTGVSSTAVKGTYKVAGKHLTLIMHLAKDAGAPLEMDMEWSGPNIVYLTASATGAMEGTKMTMALSRNGAKPSKDKLDATLHISSTTGGWNAHQIDTAGNPVPAGSPVPPQYPTNQPPPVQPQVQSPAPAPSPTTAPTPSGSDAPSPGTAPASSSGEPPSSPPGASTGTTG